MSEPEAGSDVGNLQCQRRAPERRLRPQRAEDLDLAPPTSPTTSWSSRRTDSERLQARGADDALGPDRTPRGSRSAASRRWAARRSTTSSSPTATCPPSASLGQVDGGWMQLMAGPERRAPDHRPRPSLGIAQRAFDDALAYVKERKQFGRPIGSFQTLKHRLADLATELECCAAAGLRRRAQGRGRPRPDAPPRGVDGEAEGHRDGEEGRAGGHADDGRLRLRDRVRHGAATSAPDAGRRRSTPAPARSSARSSRRPTGCSGAQKPTDSNARSRSGSSS